MHPIHETELEFLYYELKELGRDWETYFQSIDPTQDLNHDLLDKIKKVCKCLGSVKTKKSDSK